MDDAELVRLGLAAVELGLSNSKLEASTRRSA
jgi:hypothetical protein